MPNAQAIDPAAIKVFLAERGYKLQTNWHETDIFRRADGVVSFDASYPSENEALKAGLRHWLQESSPAYQVFDERFRDMPMQDVWAEIANSETIAAIRQAIAWHEALSAEKGNNA